MGLVPFRGLLPTIRTAGDVHRQAPYQKEEDKI